MRIGERRSTSTLPPFGGIERKINNLAKNSVRLLDYSVDFLPNPTEHPPNLTEQFNVRRIKIYVTFLSGVRQDGGRKEKVTGR